MLYPESGHAERNVSSIAGVHREKSRAQGIREAFKQEWHLKWYSVFSDISRSFKGTDSLWAFLSSEPLSTF